MVSEVVSILKHCYKCDRDLPRGSFHYDRYTLDKRRNKCRECVAEQDRERKRNPTPKFTAYKHKRQISYRQRRPNNALYQGLRLALKRRPTDNPVTTAELVDIFNEQHGKCALSGILMTWGGRSDVKGAFQPNSMSIDRIDQSQGYIKDNVRLICTCFNSFRGRMTDAEMLLYAQALVNNISGGF